MIRFIYIAGPLSPRNGETQEHNVRRALDVASFLLDEGYSPYVPHLCHYWDRSHPRSYEAWMNLDFSWIERCDALLRIPGESPGADREVGHAIRSGIPVYYSIAEMTERAA